MTEVRAGSSSAAHTRGCSSPAWPTTRSPTSSSAQRPGCQGARSPARTVSSTPGGGGDDPRGLDRVGPAGRPPGPHQPRGSRLPGQRDGHVPGLRGHRTEQRGQRLVVRTAVDARHRRGERWSPGNTAPCSNSARSRWPRERLRASVASRPGSSVVRSAGSSSESGLRTTTDRAAEVVVGQAQRVERRRPDERVGRRLDVAGLGQRAADAAPAALPSVSPRPGGAVAGPRGCRRSRRAGRPPRPGRPGR